MSGNQVLLIYIFRDQTICQIFHKNWWEVIYLTKAQILSQLQTGIDYQLRIKFSSATKSACGRNFLLPSFTNIPWIPHCGSKQSYFNTFSVCQASYIVKELATRETRRIQETAFQKSAPGTFDALGPLPYFQEL